MEIMNVINYGIKQKKAPSSFADGDEFCKFLPKRTMSSENFIHYFYNVCVR